MESVTAHKRRGFFLFVAILLGIIGCGTVASVQPIGKGHSSLAFSSGGPVASVFDISMPMPYSVLRYRRGLNESTDIHFGIHPTMLVLGNLGVDVGITRHFVPQSGIRPALSVETSVYGFFHMSEFSSIRAYPEITVIGCYRLSERSHAFYFGSHTMIQFAHPYFILAPFIGFEIPFGRKIILNLETKWYAPHEESEDRVVDYTLRPFNYGALGFVWGISYKF